MMLSGKMMLVISTLVLIVLAICWPQGEVNLYAELDRMLRILNPERPVVYIPTSSVAISILAWGQFTLMWGIMCYFNRHATGDINGPQCYVKPSIFIMLASLFMFSLMQSAAPWTFGALAFYGVAIWARQGLAYIDDDIRKMIEK